LWGFPYVDKIVGTIASLTVFLGAIMGISRKNYKPDEAPVEHDITYRMDKPAQKSDMFDLEGPVGLDEVKLKPKLYEDEPQQ
jgi:hypothetical protein